MDDLALKNVLLSTALPPFQVFECIGDEMGFWSKLLSLKYNVDIENLVESI